ncbi:MAG: hypothetical protein AB1640_03255 [bacterium]
MRDTVRRELSIYASTLSENCKKFTRETEKAAYFVEALYSYPQLYDLSLDGMDNRYKRHGDGYFLIEEEKRWILGASGAIPVNSRIKRELKLLENAKPKFRDVFNALNYCDEFWFFTTESVCAGWVEYSPIADTLPEKLDLSQLYSSGITRWDWYAIVGPVNNPGRVGIWSPFPCVDLYGQWVFAYDFPVYVEEQYKGVVAPHAKIEYMLNDSIYKSKERMLVVHDDSTLIGMNAAAQESFDIECYEYRAWDDHSKKISYVRTDLNLMNNKTQSIVELADALKWQNEFEISIGCKSYLVMRERVPEIKCSIVACIDK